MTMKITQVSCEEALPVELNPQPAYLRVLDHQKNDPF